jgi:hypothetical protein
MFDDFDTQVQCEEVYREDGSINEQVEDLILEMEVKEMLELL